MRNLVDRHRNTTAIVAEAATVGPGGAQPWIGDGPTLLALVAFSTVCALYFVARYSGHWAETDTATYTQAIRSVVDSGSLIPPNGDALSGGYGYVAVSSFLSAVTGVPVATLEQILYPLTSAFLVFPAWVLYRELTGSRRAATLATLLLFIQPEFLFVVLRGSHERLLRALMMTSIWLLARSFRHRGSSTRYAVHVGLFYMAAYALITTNMLFGISFFTAMALGMLVAYAFGVIWRGRIAVTIQLAHRLAYVTLIATGLGIIIMFYLYPPAIANLLALDSLAKELQALYLTARVTVAYNPYAVVEGGWVSLPVYFLVSLGDYLLIPVSAAIWIGQTVRWLRAPVHTRRVTTGYGLLWLLYGAFALQGVLAVLSDQTGSLAGNLEDRAFPSFAMVAAPIVASAFARWRPKQAGAIAASLAFALLTALALAKATNEPVVSNYWEFYVPSEIEALHWADQHNRYATIWTGMNERLATAYTLAAGDSTENNRWTFGPLNPTAREMIETNDVRLYNARLGKPLPPTDAANRIYDAGSAQLYRLRPKTPYQR